MALAMSIFGVAFAAFCVWLTVRVMNRRERWAKWTLTGVIGLPILYVASIGPACWITSRTNRGGKLIPKVYQPVIEAFLSGGYDSQISRAFRWYSTVGAADHWGWFDISPDMGSEETAWCIGPDP